MTEDYSTVQIGLRSDGGVIVFWTYSDGCKTQIEFGDMESFDMFLEECASFKIKAAPMLATMRRPQ